ncbi:MAG: DUF302 domain-containing protein, partial [bacterium]|nr:DUF302 domain-containing protein [bacterium]
MLLRTIGLLLILLGMLTLPLFAAEEAEEMEAGEEYYLEAELTVPFAEAKTLVTAALAAQGFTVLTEIDLQAKFKEKLNQDIPPYTILGACGPGFAHRAWEINTHVGVMLPCTVVLEQEGDVVEVLFRDPRGLAQFDPALAPLGEEVYLKIKAVIEALGGDEDEDDEDEDEHEGH